MAVTAGARIVERLEALIQKGDRVVATRRNPPSNVIGPQRLDAALFSEWRAQSAALVVGLLGPDHVYATRFDSDVKAGTPTDVERGIGILRAVLEDATQGALVDLRLLMAADVFADFLEMARHLLEAGYHVAAASLAGAVLEDGLRRLATRHDVRVKDRDDAGGLNSRLAQANVYTRLTQKKLQVAIDVRNHADHGEFGKVSSADVEAEMATVEAFMADYLIDRP